MFDALEAPKSGVAAPNCNLTAIGASEVKEAAEAGGECGWVAMWLDWAGLTARGDKRLETP